MPEIHQTVFHIAAIWNREVGDSDAGWNWIKLSDYGKAIHRAEEDVNQIGSKGDPARLRDACQHWLAAWVAAIKAWNDMDSAEIVEPGAAQSNSH